MKKKIPSEAEVINNIVLGSENPTKNPPNPSKAVPVMKAKKPPESELPFLSEAKAAEETARTSSTSIADATPKKKTSGIIMFIIGLFAFIVGAALLIKTLTDGPAIIDADYLVEIGGWERSDEPTVIWNFTGIGKGTLTTNNHKNDYDFIWSLDDGKLMVETDWLYTLNNSYAYDLDQSKNVLTLFGDDGEILYTFIPVETETDAMIEAE